MVKAQLKGIGGWLLVYVIFGVYGMVSTLSSMITSLSGSIKEQLKILNEVGITLHPLPLPFEVFMWIIGLGLPALSLILIFLKRRAAVAWTQTSLWVNFALAVASMTYAFMDVSIGYILISLMFVLMGAFTLAWSLYFAKSRRVKNTLVG